MEVSPLKYTRAAFGTDAQAMSDPDILRQFIEQNQDKYDPTTDLNDVIRDMEVKGKEIVAASQANSSLKATRRVFGDEVLGVSDDDIYRQFIEQKQISPDTPLETVAKMMENSAMNALYEQDKNRDGDSVNSIFQLPDAVKTVKELTGTTGQTLLAARDIDEAVDLRSVYNFLKPEEARDGFIETAAKEAAVAGIPFFSRLGKRAGQYLARLGTDNPERMKDLDDIENTLTDPEAIARFVAETERFKESPELFSEKEVENLKQAALAFETTSPYFETESGAVRDAFTAGVESFALPVIKGIAQVAGFATNAGGLDREFTDDALRKLNFTDEVLANQDEESKSAIAGSILGSVAQTILAVGTGVGAAGLFAVYGVQGAGSNLEEYRQFVRSQGADPEVGIEAILALGGAAISGGLASALTGKTIGEIPVLKKFTAEAQRKLFQRAVEGGLTSGLTKDTIFKKGIEVARKVMSDPKLIAGAAKSYGSFAAATAPVEAFEEISESLLNEGLMNLAVENYETDPDAFKKELFLSGLGGLIGGAAVGPVVKGRYTETVRNTTNNVLGIEHLAAASPAEAKKNILTLERRVNTINQMYGRVPAPAMAEYTKLREKLRGVASGELKVSEAFTPEELANGGGNILSIGDILSRGDLHGSAIAQAASGNVDKKSAVRGGIASTQRDAHLKLIKYFEDSDLAQSNPELLADILDRLYMTPIDAGKGKRTAATTTASTLGKDGRLNRSFIGTYLTNSSDEFAIQDEIFHILNDSKSDEDQQAIVTAFNTIYGTNHKSYADGETRDAIAKKAAAIVTGKAKARDSNMDNAFTRIVEAQRNGQILEVNPNLSVFKGQFKDGIKTEGEKTSIKEGMIPVTTAQIQDALSKGKMRRISPSTRLTTTLNKDGKEIPSQHAGKIFFQDEVGMVFTYEAVTDSEGNETGILNPLGIERILPTEGPSAITGVQRLGETRDVRTIRHEAMLTDMFQQGLIDEEVYRLEMGRQAAEQDEAAFQKSIEDFLTGEIDREQFNFGLAEIGMTERQNAEFQQQIDDFKAGLTSEAEFRKATEEVERKFREAIVKRESGPLARRESGPIVPYTGPRETTPNAPKSPNGFFVDPNGVTIEVVDGLPVRAFRTVQVSGADGVVFEIIQPVDVDLEEAKRLYDLGIMDQVPESVRTPKQLRMGDRAARLLDYNRLRHFYNNPQAYLQALKEDEQRRLPEAVRKNLQEIADENTRLQEQKAQLAQETGEAIYETPKTEKQKKERKPNATTPMVNDLVRPEVYDRIPKNVRRVVEALLTGKTAGVKGTKGVAEGLRDATSGFPLIEITNADLLKQLKSLGLVQGGNALMGEVVVPTVDNVVAINPDIINVPLVESLESDIDQEQNEVVDTDSINTLIQTATPTKGPGTGGKNIDHIELIDIEGNRESFPNVTSANNALAERYGTDNVQRESKGGKTFMFAGPNVFEIEKASKKLDEIIRDGFGDDAARIGKLLNDVTDSDLKSDLVRTVKKFTKQLIHKATGSSLYKEADFEAARRDMNMAVAAAQNFLTPVAEVITETEVVTEPEIQVNDPAPVNMDSSKTKEVIRKMRKAVGRGALKEIPNSGGRFEFKTEKINSVNVFRREAEENLGVTDIASEEITEDGKKKFVVTGTFHPDVAANTFSKSNPELHKMVNAPIVADPTVVETPVVHDPTGKKKRKRIVKTTDAPIYTSTSEAADAEPKIDLLGFAGSKNDTKVGSAFTQMANEVLTKFGINKPVHIIDMSLPKEELLAILTRLNPDLDENARNLLKDVIEEVGGGTVDPEGFVIPVYDGLEISAYIVGSMKYSPMDGSELSVNRRVDAFAHELGHIVTIDLIVRYGEDILADLQKFYEEQIEENLDNSLLEFMTKTSGAIDSKVLADTLEEMGLFMPHYGKTLRQLREGSYEERAAYNYAASFSEWLARGFGKNFFEASGDVEFISSQPFQKFYKKVRSALEKVFKFFSESKYIDENKTFENWTREVITGVREGTLKNRTSNVSDMIVTFRMFNRGTVPTTGSSLKNVQKSDVDVKRKGQRLNKLGPMVLNPIEAMNESWNQKKELGYARPIFSKKTPVGVRRMVEDFSKTFGVDSPIHVVYGTEADINEFASSMPTELAKGYAKTIKAAEESLGLLQVMGSERDGVNFGYLLFINVEKLIENTRLFGTDQRAGKVLETVSHELGHALMFDLRQKFGKEFESDIRAEYDRLYARLNEMTAAEFMENFVEAGAAMIIMEDIVGEGKSVADLNVADLRNLGFSIDYFTSYEEWIARQFARWVSSGGPNKPVVTSRMGEYFKKVADKLREAFKFFYDNGTFDPNKKFEEWMEEVVAVNQVRQMIREGRKINPVSTEGFATNPLQESAQHLSVVDYYMDSAEIVVRNENETEIGVRDEVMRLREKVKNWQQIETDVRQGKVIEGDSNQIRYGELFRTAQGLADRQLPDGEIPFDVMVSYASAASLFPAALSERMEIVWNKFRNSFWNDARRRLLSPIIVRAEMVANDHPEIKELTDLIRKTMASPGQDTAGVPYTDSILRELTLRTGEVTKILDPIFRHYGFSGVTAKKVYSAVAKRKNLSEMMNLVFRGVRNKSAVQQELGLKFDGVSLEQIIDEMRVAMDNLAAYAEEQGMLDIDDMIKYDDGGVQHYAPRVYDRETVLANIEYFRDFIVARNLERVYKIDKYVEQKQKEEFAATGQKLSLAQIEVYSKNVPDSFKLTPEDKGNIERISEAITNKIAYGRPMTMTAIFNPDYQASKNFADIIEDYGSNVPDRLKERKLWFIPDEELLGEVEIGGKKITFVDTNIAQVMARSIESVVKRVEFARAYGKRGQLFSVAEEKLNEKIKANAGDPRAVNKIRRDLDALRSLFESVAEIVDASKPGSRRFLNEAPIRNTISVLSKATTMAVMGLSSFLAIAETGNMFVRTGWKGGMVGMAKFVTTATAKTLKWPAVALGFTGNYTDIMEDELVSLGYIHELGQDIASRSRFDPFFTEEGSISGNELANFDAALKFGEDAFYRFTMLEQITRISQVAAAHSSNVMIRGMRKSFESAKGLNKAQIRDLKRLGFVTPEGEFNQDEFAAYMDFFADLEVARSKGPDALRTFAVANKSMFDSVHYRVTGRLISQQITRPNVVTRTNWGNSKNPLIRAAYRLRSFTHGYRSLIGGYFTEEARAMYEDKDLTGLAMFITRFVPLLILAAMTMVAREELKADLHEMAGNTEQAETIRTQAKNMTAADHILNAFDKSGLTMQGTEIINAFEGSKYGGGLFSAIYGVPASRAEKLYDDTMRSAYTGDLSYILNGVSGTMVPAANTGAFDWMKVDPFVSEAEESYDADFYGSSGYNW